MTSYSYQTVGYAGTDITFTAAAGGVLGDGITTTDNKGFLWVKNAAAGGTITVSLNTPGTTVAGLAVPNVDITVPDGEQRLIGPIVTELGDPLVFGGLLMSITPNATGVTAAAVKVP